MSKIIPVICIVAAGLILSCAALCLIFVCMAVKIELLGIVAIPMTIIGMMTDGISIVTTAYFKKDKLCRVALFINLGSLALYIAALIVWGVGI